MLGKYNMNVNKKVKDLRKKNGYTQEQLAELLNMKTSTYSQMERSGKIPIHTAIDLADIFKMDVKDLLMVDDSAENANPEEQGKIDEILIIDNPPTDLTGLKLPTIPLVEEPVEEKFLLSNREENAIIMLRNLSSSDREEIYRLIKLFHDKKFKK